MQEKEWPLSKKMTDWQNDIPSGQMCYFILCLFYTSPSFHFSICVHSWREVTLTFRWCSFGLYSMFSYGNFNSFVRRQAIGFEALWVGVAHEVRGCLIYCFLSLMRLNHSNLISNQPAVVTPKWSSALTQPHYLQLTQLDPAQILWYIFFPLLSFPLFTLYIFPLLPLMNSFAF